MASNNECFLSDDFNFHAKIGFFESRKEVVVFMINVILNIQKFIVDFCKCNDKTTCLPCEIAESFNEKLTYEIYENCFNLDLLLKVKENLDIQLLNLQEAHNHFLCKILNENYEYHQEKFFFTGRPINVSVKEACREWEKIKIEKILNQKLTVTVSDFLKGAVFTL